ncbi:MAG: DUF454 family protein [Saccharofermentans sp.]|nr:DUF454 family protein [Saccharofermentans sp.]
MRRYYKDDIPEEKKPKTIFGRILWISLGIVMIIVGLIGLMIPVVPQVPFFVAGALCFCRVSRRFGGWFRHLRLYKLFVGEIKFRDFFKKDIKPRQSAA